MAQLWFAVWGKLCGQTDQESAEIVYRQAVGSLFFHRFVMCALTDPCGYGILDEYPDKVLHDKLNAIALVLGKLSFGMLFSEEQRYMMQFNQFISDNIHTIDALLGTLCDGSLLGKNFSEHARVPKKLYQNSLGMFSRMVALYT